MKLRQHLNQYININLHRECCKTSFTHYFIVTAKNLIWPVVFFVFLFMVTGRGIIFICSTTFHPSKRKKQLIHFTLPKYSPITDAVLKKVVSTGGSWSFDSTSASYDNIEHLILSKRNVIFGKLVGEHWQKNVCHA